MVKRCSITSSRCHFMLGLDSSYGRTYVVASCTCVGLKY